MKIIIISPAYPPYSGVGSMRMNSLSKYLNQFHEIIVLRNTPALWGEENLKMSPPKNIRIIDVHANGSFNENASAYYNQISKLLDKEKFDLMIYSVGPYYTLKVAPKIKSRYKIKYIIDFRDLWIYEKKTINSKFKRLKRQILLQLYKNIENKAVKESNAIVTVTPLDREIMISKHKLPEKKAETIFNGHEVSNVDENLTNYKVNPTSISILSFGKLGYYSIELCEILFNSLEKVSDKNHKITLVHIGGKEDPVLELINRNHYQNFLYDHRGYMEYHEAIELIKTCDICVNIYNHPTGLGTKVFDYISCNKPILLITQNGKYLSGFLSQFENAQTCKTEEQTAAFIRYIRENKINYLDKGNNYLTYSRENQNRLFEKLIKNVPSQKVNF